MALTESQIKKAEPRDKMYKLSDGRGLVVQVRKSGAKVFVKEYRFNGQRTGVTLGEFPGMKLAVARHEAERVAEQVRQGINPRDDGAIRESPTRAKPKPGASAPVPEERRVEVLAAKFIRKRMEEGVAEATLSKLNWNLGGLANGVLRGRDIASIKPPEILALIEEVQAEGKIEKAKDIHRKLGQLFDYAIALGLVEWNPAQMVRRAVVQKKGGEHPGLTNPRDVGGLMRAIRLYPATSGQQTRAALLLSAYTFLRSRELRGARWPEIDFDAALWTVPRDRMKGKVGDHLVPLSRQALDIFKALHLTRGDNDLVFPMPSYPDRYMSENTLNAALRRLGYDTRKDHSHHGFRTTFSTNMNEQGWNRDWIERQLAHTSKDDVRASYNKALYLDGRTEMMQHYADWLDGLAA
jgi:integrase